MTNLQILSTFLALDVALLAVCAIMLWRETWFEFFLTVGLVAVVGAIILGICTYDSYKWSNIPDCIVSTQHTVYWVNQPSGEETKIAWIHLEGRTFCQVQDPEAFYTGIGNHLNRTFIGKAEYR